MKTVPRSTKIQPWLLLVIVAVTILAGCDVPYVYKQDPLTITNLSSATVQIDGARQFQAIDGFGTNINGASWDNGTLAPVLDQLGKPLGGNIFRVILETADWEAQNDNSDPRTFNWNYYNPIYETPKFQSLWKIIQYLERDPQHLVILNVMGQVPEWMGGKSIRADAEDEWVEMVASAIYYGRTVKKLRLSLLSPVNETDLGYPEGPQVDPAQLDRILGKLVARLHTLGLDDIEIVGPDIAYIKNAAKYLEPLLANHALMAKLKHFSFHSYDGKTRNVDTIIKGSEYPDRNFWMTEFSQWCNSCDQNARESEQWSFAAQTVDFLLQHLQEGASAALVYDGFDSTYEHHGTFDYWALVSYDPHTKAHAPRKRYYANAQVFRFVRPGMRRIDTTVSSPYLKVLAFAEPTTGDVTIVGRNTTSSRLTLKGTLSNLTVGSPLTLTRTTQSVNLAATANITLAGNEFSIAIDPDSVFALSTIEP